MFKASGRFRSPGSAGLSSSCRRTASDRQNIYKEAYEIFQVRVIAIGGTHSDAHVLLLLN
jgi:hypothetical protein